MHSPQQPRRGLPSNVFRAFGRRWSLINCRYCHHLFHVVSFWGIVITVVDAIELFSQYCPRMSDYRQKFVTSVYNRCKFVDASSDTLSFSAVVFFERCIWQPRVSLYQSPTVSWLTSPSNVLEIWIGWDEKLWLADEAQRWNFQVSTLLIMRCDPGYLLQIFAKTITVKFQYLQILPCNVYCTIPLLVNSAPPSKH